MNNEEWKDVKGYEGMYQVSNTGKVRSFLKSGPGTERKNKPELINGAVGVHGYSYVVLCKSTKKVHTIHRLVAHAFIPNPKNKRCVNHLDSDKSNNHVSNLEWCTHSENSKHAHSNGRQKNVFRSGAKHPESKLTESDVLTIKERYSLKEVNQYELADEYGISQQQVSRIVNNQTWGHLS